MMKNNLFLMLFIAGILNFERLNAQFYETNKNSVCDVHFQSSFNKDTVSFWIENILIFEDLILESSPIIGSAGTKIQIFNIEKFLYKILIFDRNIFLKKRERLICLNKKRLKFSIKINEVKIEHTICISKGKYIGISRWGVLDDKKNIRIKQSKKVFEYY